MPNAPQRPCRKRPRTGEPCPYLPYLINVIPWPCATREATFSEDVPTPSLIPLAQGADCVLSHYGDEWSTSVRSTRPPATAATGRGVAPEGAAPKAIARELGLSEETIKTYIKQVCHIYRVQGPFELVAQWLAQAELER